MDVRRLQLLRDFADRGSIGAVADAMHLTPSAVSQQLKVLAREVDIDILEADGRGVRLTDAGRALVLRADDVIAAVERATDEMASHRRTARGSVRLAVFPSAAAMLLPTILIHAAEVDVDVIATDLDVSYHDAVAALSDYDVVLTHRDERAPMVTSPRVAAKSVLREPVDVIVSAKHRLAQQDSVVAADLLDEEWISVRGGFPVDDVLISLATMTGVQPRIVHRINDFTTIERMVAADLGIALLPRYVAGNDDVVHLTIREVKMARRYDLLHRPQAQRRPAISAVCDVIMRACAGVAQ